jgi:hypothetical protein
LDYAPLKTYIDQQTPTVKRKLAPILSAVDEEIARNDVSKTGQISINQLDDRNNYYRSGNKDWFNQMSQDNVDLFKIQLSSLIK